MAIFCCCFVRVYLKNPGVIIPWETPLFKFDRLTDRKFIVVLLRILFGSTSTESVWFNGVKPRSPKSRAERKKIHEIDRIFTLGFFHGYPWPTYEGINPFGWRINKHRSCGNYNMNKMPCFHRWFSTFYGQIIIYAVINARKKKKCTAPPSVHRSNRIMEKITCNDKLQRPVRKKNIRSKRSLREDQDHASRKRQGSIVKWVIKGDPTL